MPLKNSFRLPPVSREKALHDLRAWMGTIRFARTLFPLSLVLLGAVLAARGLPSLPILLGLFLAVAGLRSFAVTLHSLVSLERDRLKPRACASALVKGELSASAARLFAFVAVLTYFAGCLLLNRTALVLSPLPLLAVIACARAARYGWWTHFLRGLCFAFAPAGGWIGVDPGLSLTAALLACAVLFWTAGVDIVAACRNVDFDTACGLRTAPTRFGVPVSLSLAAFSHAVFVLFLFMAFWAADMGWGGFIVWAPATVLTLWPYRRTPSDDVNRLFGTMLVCTWLVAALLLVGVLTALLV